MSEVRGAVAPTSGPGDAEVDEAILDEVVGVREEEAFVYARRLAREEGISAGISSGASVAVASVQLSAMTRMR